MSIFISSSVALLKPLVVASLHNDDDDDADNDNEGVSMG